MKYDDKMADVGTTHTTMMPVSAIIIYKLPDIVDCNSNRIFVIKYCISLARYGSESHMA